MSECFWKLVQDQRDRIIETPNPDSVHHLNKLLAVEPPTQFNIHTRSEGDTTEALKIIELKKIW